MDEDHDDQTNEEDAEVEKQEQPKEVEPVAQNPLSKDVIVSGLGLLCKIGNGIDYAYVRADLHSKALTDIEALRSYRHLRYVDLSDNKITDLSPLEGLPELVSFKADRNAITAVKLPPHPYLQEVSLAGNKLTEVAGVSLPMLSHLNVSTNKITTLSLQPNQVPALTFLDLHGNGLKSVAPLASLTTLTTLYIAQNALTSLEGISALVGLKRLHVRQNQISTLDGFSSALSSLEYINLRQNSVAELKEVAKLGVLPALKALVLADNPVSESGEYRMEVLVALRALVRLDKVSYEIEERTEASEIAARRAQGQEAGVPQVSEE